MELRVEDMVSHLQQIRQTQGEEDYQLALQGLVKHLLIADGTDVFIQSLLQQLNATLDIEALKTEAETLKASRKAAEEVVQKASGGADLNKTMIEAIRSQMPNLKTQAQFDLVMATFESLQLYLNAAFGSDPNLGHYRTSLERGLELAVNISAFEDKVQELSDEAKQKHKDFVEAPKEFSEEGKVQQMLSDLKNLESLEVLQQWYRVNKPTMDSIVTQQLRNQLFDAIRIRRNELSN